MRNITVAATEKGLELDEIAARLHRMQVVERGNKPTSWPLTGALDRGFGEWRRMDDWSSTSFRGDMAKDVLRGVVGRIGRRASRREPQAGSPQSAGLVAARQPHGLWLANGAALAPECREATRFRPSTRILAWAAARPAREAARSAWDEGADRR
jgi:hypothetical protein